MLTARRASEYSGGSERDENDKARALRFLGTVSAQDDSGQAWSDLGNVESVGGYSDPDALKGQTNVQSRRNSCDMD